MARNDWGTVLVSEKLLKNNSEILIASVLIHEAFHFNYLFGYSGHVKCPVEFQDPNFREKHACDDTAFGSYWVQYIWAESVIKFCSNYSDEVKSELRKAAAWGIERIIFEEAKTELVNDVGL